MPKYKIKFAFDDHAPKLRKYTVWICGGKGVDGLPCSYEAEKHRTVRHYAAKHLKIKHTQQLEISILLRDYDIRITKGSYAATTWSGFQIGA